MGRIWGRVTSSDKGSDDRGAASQTEAPAQRYTAVASLEAIGMHNETLRAEIEGIELGFEHFESVKSSFRGGESWTLLVVLW